MDAPESLGEKGIGIDEAYRPLSFLYLTFLSIWFVSAFSWTVNTWKNRHFQVILTNFCSNTQFFVRYWKNFALLVYSVL